MIANEAISLWLTKALLLHFFCDVFIEFMIKYKSLNIKLLFLAFM